jgi:hypothetical protein
MEAVRPEPGLRFRASRNAFTNGPTQRMRKQVKLRDDSYKTFNGVEVIEFGVDIVWKRWDMYERG